MEKNKSNKKGQRLVYMNGHYVPENQAKISIFDSALGQAQSSSIVLRNDMYAGQTVNGPAAIIEDETTVIVPSSRHAIMQSDGCIDVRVRKH